MLIYKQIYKNDEHLLNNLIPLWIDYMREIYSEDVDVQKESDDTIKNWLMERVNIQGQRKGMHFECVFEGDYLIGFIFYAIDLGGIKGILEAGLGYIMEMYVAPEFRRKTYGTAVYEHARDRLLEDGAVTAYLTPDSNSGIPFWKNIGFTDSGKLDPDNKMPIYVKKL
jgi:GNAT superfamily N-acetyltransferase